MSKIKAVSIVLVIASVGMITYGIILGDAILIGMAVTALATSSTSLALAWNR